MMWCREVFVLSVLLMGYASPSAIPMWEFLSRGEKMSHLFNMFVKQVSSHCDTSTMPDCQKVLLVYGLTNLAKMEDDSLDQMDPYQRGATDIIWESMMKGGYKQSGQDGDNEKDEYDQFDGHTNGNQLGSQEEASSNVEEYAGAPPMGPMVVRLLPDGRPVPGDAQLPLPRDEDAEEYQAMRAKPIPSISDISSANHGQSIANYQSKPVASTTNYQNKPVSSAANYQTKPVADISAANLHASSNANLQSQQQQRIQAARKL